jgi:hypothetical protein
MFEGFVKMQEDEGAHALKQGVFYCFIALTKGLFLSILCLCLIKAKKPQSSEDE